MPCSGLFVGLHSLAGTTTICGHVLATAVPHYRRSGLLWNLGSQDAILKGWRRLGIPLDAWHPREILAHSIEREIVYTEGPPFDLLPTPVDMLPSEDAASHDLVEAVFSQGFYGLVAVDLSAETLQSIPLVAPMIKLASHVFLVGDRERVTPDELVTPLRTLETLQALSKTSLVLNCRSENATATNADSARFGQLPISPIRYSAELAQDSCRFFDLDEMAVGADFMQIGRVLGGENISNTD